MSDNELIQNELTRGSSLNNSSEPSPVGFISIDKEGSIIQMSDGTRDILRIPESKGIGKKLTSYIDKEYHSILKKRLRNYFDGMDLPPQKYKMITHDGYSIWVESLVIPLLNSKDKNIDSLKFLVREISTNNNSLPEKKELDTTKNASQVTLSKFTANILSMVSHDLKTPLTAIYSSVQLLEKYGRDWDIKLYNQQIKRVGENVRRLISILENILFISRKERYIVSSSSIMTDVEKLCKSIIDESVQHLKEHQKIVTEISLKNKFVQINELVIRQILQNLISNAIKYSPPGEEIRCIINSDTKKMEIIIADNGIGIPEKDKYHIFKLFCRGSNTEETEGSGLGLTIIKNIIDIAGGTIEFESNSKQGTTFKVILPL